MSEMMPWKEFSEHMRGESKNRRARNRAYGYRKLEELGLPIEVKNNGAHIIIGNKFDYWPGTGKWIERGTGEYKRGIKSLLKRIEKVTIKERTR